MNCDFGSERFLRSMHVINRHDVVIDCREVKAVHCCVIGAAITVVYCSFAQHVLQ